MAGKLVCVKSLRKALLRLVGILRRPGLPGTFRQSWCGHGHSSAASPDGFQRHGKQQWGKESPHRSRPMVRYSTGQQAVSLMFAEGFRMPRGKRPCSFHILTCGFLCNYTQALKVYFNTLHTQYDIITEKSIYLTKIPNYGPRGRTAQCATRTVGARSITPEMAQISPSFGAWQDPFTSAKHGSPGLVLSRGFLGEISRLLPRLLLLLAAVHVLCPLFQITRDVRPYQKESKDSVFFPAHNTSSGSNLDKKGSFFGIDTMTVSVYCIYLVQNTAVKNLEKLLIWSKDINSHPRKLAQFSCNFALHQVCVFFFKQCLTVQLW